MLMVFTSAGSGLMHSYHNVAELRQFRGAFCWRDRQSPAAFWPTGEPLTPNQALMLAAAAVDLNIEVPDFLPQRVAVQPEQVRSPNLIAARRGQCRREQRHLDLLQNAVIEARRRHAVGKSGEVRRQVG